MDTEKATTTIPLNRIIAFAGPHISWLAGLLATWLLTHVHFLGVFHVGHDTTAAAIEQAIVFGVVTAVTWLGHQKWLTGHHIELETQGALEILATEKYLTPAGAEQARVSSIGEDAPAAAVAPTAELPLEEISDPAPDDDDGVGPHPVVID